MSREPRLYLQDILEAIRRVRLLNAGMDPIQFREDWRTQDATLRNLEILGEAALAGRYGYHSFMFRLLPLPLLLLAAVLPARAADRKPAKTWATLIEFVLKNGAEDPVMAPSARELGYDADEVAAWSMRVVSKKSPDGKEHRFYVVYEKDAAGARKPKEIVLSVLESQTKDGKHFIHSYRVRLSSGGKLLRGKRAAGFLGEVVQSVLPNDSPELLGVYKGEKDFYFKTLDWAQLTATD